MSPGLKPAMRQSMSAWSGSYRGSSPGGQPLFSSSSACSLQQVIWKLNCVVACSSTSHRRMSKAAAGIMEGLCSQHATAQLLSPVACQTHGSGKAEHTLGDIWQEYSLFLALQHSMLDRHKWQTPASPACLLTDFRQTQEEKKEAP